MRVNLVKLLRTRWLALPFRASAAGATLLRRERSAAKPLAAILVGVGVLTVYAFRANITDSERLPGIDAPIHHAWEDYTQSVVDAGKLPHWNPYSWAGTPYLAAPSTGVLYPPALPLRWLEPAAFLKWMIILHLLIGAAGAAFVTRVVGVGWWGAAAAALAVALGGGSSGWVHEGAIPLLYNSAWLPWALALSILSVRRRSLLPHPALPFVLVVQFMAALQPALYITGAVSLYYLFSVAWPENRDVRRWWPLPQLAVLGALTAGLSAFQLLPVYELARDSARLAGLSFERATAYGWAPRDMATVFWPLTGIDQEPVFRFAAHRTYVGWILACVLPFAFTDRSRRRMILFFALLAAGATLLALGSATPVFRLHYVLFPGLRVPGRVLFVTTLSLAVLGALGFERFITLTAERRWRAVVGAFIVASLGLAAATIVAWQNAASDVAPPSHLWPWLPAISIAGLIVVATLSVRRHLRVALATGVLILAVDVTAFFSTGVDTVPIERIETLRQWVGPPDTGRLWSLCPNRIGSNEMLLVRRPGLGGTVDLDLNTFAHWLQLVNTPDRLEDVLGPQHVRRDLLDSANVTTFVSCEPLDDSDLTLVSHLAPVFAYRNERAWPRATWTCGALELSRAMVAQELKLGRYDGMGTLQRQPWLSVRWAAGVSDDERQALESKHGLLHGVHQDTTWRYVIGDPTPDNLRRLARHPSVADTNGLNRGTGELIADAVIEMPDKLAREMELLVGAAPCRHHADVEVLIADQPDGHVAAVVDAPVNGGFVFFSEPYYRERRAVVDGRPVPARRANLAFIAVPVPAGRHRVELQMVPTSFYAGVGLSGLTLTAWCFAAGYGARRRWLGSQQNPPRGA
jgi:hypothetical protein